LRRTQLVLSFCHGSAGCRARKERSLLVVISWTGCDRITLPRGRAWAKIPHLRKFLHDGSYAQGVTGVIPTVTYPSHTTLMTGVWPAKHGILANQTFDPLQKNHEGWYWYAEDIRVRRCGMQLRRLAGRRRAFSGR